MWHTRRSHGKTSLRIAAVILFGWLLTNCIGNQPAIRAAEPDLAGPQNSNPTTSAQVVDIQTGLATPTPIVRVSEIDGMEMVYVHAGSFMMGSRSNPFPSGFDPNLDALPRHEVNIDAFWIDKTEVTNSMYALCERARMCQRPDDQRLSTAPFYYGNPNYLDYPVVSVTWFQARDYCEWAGRRLPTEAEWEKAARGTDGRNYPWGHFTPSGDLMNVCDRSCLNKLARVTSFDDGFAEVAPVYSFSRGVSPYGALNMAGNVWEWVADWYSEDYYDVSPTDNPAGPPTGEVRVFRGGAWSNSVELARAATRASGDPGSAWEARGFRCAISASP